MNGDDITSLLDAGFKVGGIGAGGFYWWLMRRIAEKIDTVEKELSAHQLYTEQTFNTKTEAQTSRAETNSLLQEVRRDVSDIKTMLVERLAK